MMGYLNLAVLGLMIVIALYLIRILIYRLANMPYQEKLATQDMIESVILALALILLFQFLNISMHQSAQDQLATFSQALRNLTGAYTLGSPQAGDSYLDIIISYMEIYRELIISIKDKAVNDYDIIVNRFAGLDFSIAGISYRMLQRVLEQVEGKDKIATELAKLGFIIRSSFNIIVNLSVVIEALRYLREMAPLIIITGIVLRALYLTKGIGSVLISFAFSFYFFFPVILSMFLGNQLSNVEIGIQGTKLKVDGTSYYSAQLMSFDLDKYSRATESVKNFLNFVYNRLNIAIWVSMGLSLGIAFYMYGLLTGGSLIWGAPIQFLRLL